MARKKEDVVLVRLEPAFAQVVAGTLGSVLVREGIDLTPPERDVMKLLFDAVRSANLNYMRGG